ncbi:COQ9 family protein [Sphingorhabdus soli]|uniref:COQ9 family protein n=1 Tax=Flavisphingopyxis soli TaxID=2601267 RepID=A0A5C6UKF2_9SPHN|nr:COQ9 family protein [Sphingorhabdus soli]TXC73337.1 COQ9 family protein [Sphingorhabdus soli]
MAQTDLPDDPTLDEVRAALAPRLAADAAFDGWGTSAVASAADALGIDPDIAALAFPGGATDMIDAWFGWIDVEMARRLPPETLGAMKIRARIAALVETRLAIVANDKEALRRALAILAMPQNIAKGTRLGWRAADTMWRLAGDTATDYNHYTKRGLLGTIYAATLTVFLDDESEGFADTRAFLSRRIDNVMQFEKAKAGFLKRRTRIPSLSRFIGRLRYPGV